MGIADGLEMKWIHIMPRVRERAHTDEAGAHCWCEPLILRVDGFPLMRVALHQGVSVSQIRAESARIGYHLGRLY